ncbi:MAG TPA: SCO family protein [Lacibacter sp.]|nr:SCO family protein [Lacibacter sp.]HMO88303.1 SCO family protein [Lacibacter sp.]HMP86579.1 SCO family protein [Lacibacter sp.]
MMKKLLYYAVFFVVLLGGFYLALFWGTDWWRKKLPVINDVKEFAFVSQQGDTITNRNVAGRVQVVEFFFTTCKGICPKMNTNMLVLYKEFAGEPDFLILSHTVDPGTDSVARLKQYGDSLQISPERWLLLTGTKEKLYEAARKSYLLDDQNNEQAAIEEQFIHTQLFALVDRAGGVRGIYDGLDEKELKKLRKDIRLVMTERYSGPRFVNGIFQNNPN